MTLFFLLVAKIIPLYAMILLGYVAGRFLQVSKEMVANLLIYIFGPAVIFLGTLEAGLELQIFSIVLMFFCVGTLICFVNHWIGKFLWNDGTENVAAFATGMGNIGYFGIPVCLALFGDESLPITVMVVLGLVMYINTTGFYTVARSSHTIKETIIKILKLPPLYAFLLGIGVNLFSVELAPSVLEIFELLKGGFVPLGMMIIGLGLGGVELKHFDLKFTVFTIAHKFITWPLLIGMLIFLDKMYFQFYNDLIYQVMFIESITPLAANTVTYATMLKVHPEKVAVAVVISTFLALFFIPAVTVWLI